MVGGPLFVFHFWRESERNKHECGVFFVAVPATYYLIRKFKHIVTLTSSNGETVTVTATMAASSERKKQQQQTNNTFFNRLLHILSRLLFGIAWFCFCFFHQFNTDRIFAYTSHLICYFLFFFVCSSCPQYLIFIKVRNVFFFSIYF